MDQAHSPAPPAARTWPARVALQNPRGELLWLLSPPGTWPAHHPFEVRTWADRDQLKGWVAEQSPDFRRRLAEEGWEAVDLVVTVSTATGAVLETRPIAEIAGYQ